MLAIFIFIFIFQFLIAVAYTAKDFVIRRYVPLSFRLVEGKKKMNYVLTFRKLIDCIKSKLSVVPTCFLRVSF